MAIESSEDSTEVKRAGEESLKASLNSEEVQSAETAKIDEERNVAKD